MASIMETHVSEILACLIKPTIANFNADVVVLLAELDAGRAVRRAFRFGCADCEGEGWTGGESSLSWLATDQRRLDALRVLLVCSLADLSTFAYGFIGGR